MNNYPTISIDQLSRWCKEFDPRNLCTSLYIQTQSTLDFQRLIGVNKVLLYNQPYVKPTKYGKFLLLKTRNKQPCFADSECYICNEYYYLENPNINTHKLFANVDYRLSNMRLLWNSVKATLIQKYCWDKTVLDMGSGKGGDLMKFTYSNIQQLVLS